jgi:hypothetical protein
LVQRPAAQPSATPSESEGVATRCPWPNCRISYVKAQGMPMRKHLIEHCTDRFGLNQVKLEEMWILLGKSSV